MEGDPVGVGKDQGPAADGVELDESGRGGEDVEVVEGEARAVKRRESQSLTYKGQAGGGGATAERDRGQHSVGRADR